METEEIKCICRFWQIYHETVIADANAISVTELKKEMQLAIEIAQNNPDPKKQKEFRKYFGDRSMKPDKDKTQKLCLRQ